MRRFLPALALTLLVGCATLSFDEQLASAYGVHQSVVQAAATAVTAGTLSVKDAEAVQTLAKQARGLLDAAQSAEVAGDGTGASSKLQLATTALTALQTYVNERARPSK